MRPFLPQSLRALRTLSSKTTSATSTRFLSTQLTRPQSPIRSSTLGQARFVIPSVIRHNSTANPLTADATQPETDAERERKNEERRSNEEAYRITFTCKPCGERSAHRMSKQGYHRGTVLIQCPTCKNRHVMSDHLGIFYDEKTTLESILQEKGESIKHGKMDGNLEFWDDGTTLKSNGNKDESKKGDDAAA
jgi:protein import protein ZIM17